MRPRKSTAASGMSLPTQPACWSVPKCIQPTCKTAGAPLVIAAIHDLFPWLRHLFADTAYAGDKLLNSLTKFGNWTIEIVRRMADAVAFEILPRRWVVERPLALLNRNRRLAKDFEATIAGAKAWLYLASVQLTIRRLARG